LTEHKQHYWVRHKDGYLFCSKCLVEKDGIVVKVQRMFPNCEKYKKCCTEDKEFWNKLDAKVKEWKPLKTTLRKTVINPPFEKPPKDFENLPEEFLDDKY
jgi:hypothetical protein